ATALSHVASAAGVASRSIGKKRRCPKSGPPPYSAFLPADIQPFRPPLSLIPGPKRWLTFNDGLPRPRQRSNRAPCPRSRRPSAAISSLGIPHPSLSDRDDRQLLSRSPCLNRHRARRTAGALLPAISCLGAS